MDFHWSGKNTIAQIRYLGGEFVFIHDDTVYVPKSREISNVYELGTSCQYPQVENMFLFENIERGYSGVFVPMTVYTMFLNGNIQKSNMLGFFNEELVYTFDVGVTSRFIKWDMSSCKATEFYLRSPHNFHAIGFNISLDIAFQKSGSFVERSLIDMESYHE